MATQISTSINSLHSSTGDSSTMVGSPHSSLKPIPLLTPLTSFTKPNSGVISPTSSSTKWGVPPPIIDLTILNCIASEPGSIPSTCTSLPTLKQTNSLSNTLLNSAEPCSLSSKKSRHATSSSTSNTSCSSAFKEHKSISKEQSNPSIHSKPKKTYPKDTKYPKKKSSFLLGSSSRTRAFSYPSLESGTASSSSSSSSSYRKSVFTMDRDHPLPSSSPLSPPSSPPLSPSTQSKFSKFINLSNASSSSSSSSLKSRPSSASSPISPTSPTSSFSPNESHFIPSPSLQYAKHVLPYPPPLSSTTTSSSSSFKQVKDKPIPPDPWHTIINEPRLPPNTSSSSSSPVTSSKVPPLNASNPSTSILTMDLIPLCLERKKKQKKQKEVSFNLHLNEIYYVKKYSHSLVYMLDPFEDFEICTCGIDTVWKFLKNQCSTQFKKVWKRFKSKGQPQEVTEASSSVPITTTTTTTTTPSTSLTNSLNEHSIHPEPMQRNDQEHLTEPNLAPLSQNGIDQVNQATLLPPSCASSCSSCSSSSSAQVQKAALKMDLVKEKKEVSVHETLNLPEFNNIELEKTKELEKTSMELGSVTNILGMEHPCIPLKTGQVLNCVNE